MAADHATEQAAAMLARWFLIGCKRVSCRNIERNGIAAMVTEHLVDDDPPNGRRSVRGDGRGGGDFRQWAAALLALKPQMGTALSKHHEASLNAADDRPEEYLNLEPHQTDIFLSPKGHRYERSGLLRSSR